MIYLRNWDFSKVTPMSSRSNCNNNMSEPSVTSIIIKHILYKHNLTTFEEYLRKNQTLYVRFVLKDICSGLEVLEVNSDYPLSEEDHLSYIRSYIRNKKIDEILG